MQQQQNADNKKLVYGVLIVLVLICIAAAAWYYTHDYEKSAASAPASKSGFAPFPIPPCTAYGDGAGSPYGEGSGSAYGETFAPNTAGLTSWPPYSTQSAVSLARGAESPEIASQFSKMTGVGKGALVRALADQYRGADALDRMAVFERQPGQTGYMGGDVDDSAMSLMRAISSRAAPGLPSAAIGGYEVDSDFLTDGPYGGATIRESFNSSRIPGCHNLLTGFKTGLGSTLIDPRFMPGPRHMLGDINQAPQTHAGSDSLGYLTSPAFITNGHWENIQVRGFGNDDGYPEALVTGVSRF